MTQIVHRGVDVTDKQEAEWIKQFEAIGPDEVRLHVNSGAYPQGHPRRALALFWLKRFPLESAR